MSSTKNTEEEVSAHERERRQVLRILGAGGLSVGLAGCASDSAPTESTESDDTTDESEDGTTSSGGSLNFAIPSQMSTMDVHKTNRVPEQVGLNAIHEPLFRMSPEKEPIPHLVSDYELNQEGEQFVFQIKDGITFHDGTALTGEVVAFNLQRFNDVGVNATELGGPTNIEATGEMEVTVEYDSPYPRLPVYLTGWYTGMASQQAIEEAGDSYGVDTVVGTGPFKFESWQKSERAELTRYEDYSWGPDWAEVQGPARIQDVTIRRIPEATTRVQELISGDVDATAIPPTSDAEQINDSDTATFHETNFPYPAYFTMNMEREPTSDIRVRRAINHAITRDPILQASQNGHGAPIWGLAPPVSVNGLSDEVAKENGYTYDPGRARELLDEAGWTNGSEGEVRTKNGNDLSITFLAFDLPTWSPQAEVGAQMLGDVGINVEIQISEGGAFYDTLENQEYHMVTAGTGAQFAADFLFSAFHGDNLATGGGFNSSMVDNDELNSLIDQARNDPDPETRAQAARDAGLLEREVAASVPVQVVNRTYARKNSTTGLDAFLDHPWWPTQYHIHWTDVAKE